QSGTLYNFDLCDLPETGNLPSSLIHCYQGKAFVDSNNSSKDVPLNVPTTSFSRSATRNHNLLRGIADTGPSYITFLFSTVVSYPKLFTSLATTDSKPMAAVAINVTCCDIDLFLSLEMFFYLLSLS